MKVYFIYNFHCFHISVAETKEALEVADPQSDPSQPAHITTRDIFSIILYVDIFRDYEHIYFIYILASMYGMYNAHIATIYRYPHSAFKIHTL